MHLNDVWYKSLKLLKTDIYLLQEQQAGFNPKILVELHSS